jgi:hypothetical protein
MLVSLVFSCSDQRHETSASGSGNEDVQAIEKQLRTYYLDMTSRDWQKYKSHFWDHATITTAWQAPGDSVAEVDVTTIDDFIREAGAGPDSKPVFEETMKSSKISVRGNIAEAWVEYDAKFGTTDSLMQWSGTDVFTLLRNKEEWKIVSLVFERNQ